MSPRQSSEPSQPFTRLTLLAGGALGVVFGDIGTSPLYTFRTVLSLSEHDPTPGVILGLLSLITWTLILVTSIKYAAFAMRIDNHGEGGIMALMSLLVEKGKGGRWVIFAALIGAALIYGDGAITPAISVLSALEGLEMVIPESQPYILPLTVAVLLALFLIQPFGTARIGKIFGPVMALWFLAIAALGVWGIIQHPSVLLALNPAYGIAFLFSNGYTSFLVLGVVFPSLLLNYAGQSALILAGADSKQNLFYLLCPPVLQVPLIVLAALATIIASQAIITGAFSMTRQAIQLGWLPRLRIKQTAAESYGQIYIGTINWLLMVVTIGLVVFFKSSDKLAAAYGIAVSLTMLMTTGLLFVAMREIWRWSLLSSAVIALCFFVVDATFLFANLIKVLEGGYIPLLMAAAICTVMLIWHRGVRAVSASVGEKGVSVDAFFAQLKQKTVPRVAGAAVFLTRTRNNIPPVMRWHVARNRALQQDVLSLTIDILNVPYVGEEQRISVEQRAPGYWHGVAQYGFMEHPDIPRLLQGVSEINALFATDDATWYVGHETIVAGEGGAGMAAWQRHIFAFMKRNCTHVINHYHLPSDRVVEISRRVAV